MQYKKTLLVIIGAILAAGNYVVMNTAEEDGCLVFNFLNYNVHVHDKNSPEYKELDL